MPFNHLTQLMYETTQILKNWYVVVVRSIPYKTATSVLQKLGYTFYLPLQKQLRYWSDRKRWIEVPVLSPYIFIFTSEKDRKLLFETCNFFRFLKSDGKLAVAREEEIEKVKMLCNYAVDIKIEPCHVSEGDKVTIIQGPLAGLCGYAISENGKNRFLIRIKSLGKFASVEIDRNFLKAG